MIKPNQLHNVHFINGNNYCIWIVYLVQCIPFTPSANGDFLEYGSDSYLAFQERCTNHMHFIVQTSIVVSIFYLSYNVYHVS